MPAIPSARADRALVHRAAGRQRRVLLVEGDRQRRRAAGTGAPGAARPASTTGRPSSVKPNAPASASSAISVSCSPFSPTRDRGHEAGRDARLLAGALAQRLSRICALSTTGSVFGMGDDRAVAARRRGAACRSRCPPRPRGRACAGARAGRRRRGTRAGPRRRRARRRRACRCCRARRSRRSRPSRMRMSPAWSMPARRVEQLGVLDEHVRAGLAGRAVLEDAAAHAGCGAVWRRSPARSGGRSPWVSSS